MKAPTSQALVRRHAKLSALLKAAEGEYNKIHGEVPSATIFIPELGKAGAGGFYDLSQIDAHAAKYEEKTGLVAGSAACVHFRWRMDSYRKIFVELDNLHQQWRRDAGVELAEQIQRDTYPQVEAAWAAIISRLKSGRDTAPIIRYVAAQQNVLDAWKLRQALKALGGKRVRS